MRARTWWFPVGALACAVVLTGAEGIPDADMLPASEAAVGRFVAGKLPAHVEFKYFSASCTWRDGPELHLFGNTVVVAREGILLDVTAAALAAKGISLPLPPRVTRPTIIQVSARPWETLELPSEVTCRNQGGAWVPSAFTDYGQLDRMGLPRSSFPSSLLVAGSSEAKMALSQIARKAAAAKESAASRPAPAAPAPVRAGTNAVPP